MYYFEPNIQGYPKLLETEVPDEVQGLLHHMLAIDTEERMTFDSLLQHKWITKQQQTAGPMSKSMSLGEEQGLETNSLE